MPEATASLPLSAGDHFFTAAGDGDALTRYSWSTSQTTLAHEQARRGPMKETHTDGSSGLVSLASETTDIDEDQQNKPSKDHSIATQKDAAVTTGNDISSELQDTDIHKPTTQLDDKNKTDTAAVNDDGVDEKEQPRRRSTIKGPVDGPLRSRFFGQTSRVKELFGTVLNAEDERHGEEPVFRWSEFSESEPEERALIEKARNFAIVHRKKSARNPTSGGAWDTVSIEVQSPRLLKILRRILHGYPDISEQAETLTFRPPYDSLLHRWDRLREEQRNSAPSPALEVELFIQTLGSEFQTSREAKKKVESTKMVEFDDLGFVFTPDELVVPRWQDQEETVYKLVEIYFVKYDRESPYWQLKFHQVDWDGQRFGYAESAYEIFEYKGSKSIYYLPWYPLRFVPERSALEERLLKRGRKFETLQGFHFMQYNGRKYFGNEDSDDHERLERAERNKALSGRVIVDAFTYHRFAWNGGRRSHLKPFPSEKKKDELDDPDELNERNEKRNERPTIEPIVLTDEQCKLTVARVKGHDLKDNTWCEFEVDKLEEIKFVPNAFDVLKLPQADKNLLKAVVGQTKSGLVSMDDLVAKKGKGVIILLFGPPGVGKTLTAESVAESHETPLYTLSASNISRASAEDSLVEALECCHLWKATLLIDEADVFLQARTASTIEQNQLVSIFLHRLEYYEGLVFLATNRYEDIDVAFKSRVDLALPFKDLGRATRYSIWQSFINRIPHAERNVGDKDLKSLAEHALNGREIRNMVKTSKLLAQSIDEPLNMSHLELLVKMRERAEGAEAALAWQRRVQVVLSYGVLLSVFSAVVLALASSRMLYWIRA